jgi:hypothetical protein
MCQDFIELYEEKIYLKRQIKYSKRWIIAFTFCIILLLPGLLSPVNTFNFYLDVVLFIMDIVIIRKQVLSIHTNREGIEAINEKLRGDQKSPAN